MGRDTVLVINNNLETTGLSSEDKREFRSMMKGKLNGDAAKRTSYRLIDKLGEASSKRAVQANAVANYVSGHLNHSIILCGDFNDTPLSYTRRKIGEGLQDAFVERGNGFGFTFKTRPFIVRIDHILYGSAFRALSCEVDKTASESDHHPIEAVLSLPSSTPE